MKKHTTQHGKTTAHIAEDTAYCKKHGDCGYDTIKRRTELVA